MATFSEIKQTRLNIDDPPGFIDIIKIDAIDDLPIIPAPQTVYKITTDGSYMATDLISDAAISDYFRVDLLLSDDTISLKIDDVGIDNILCTMYRLIIPKILTRMNAIRLKSGAEDIEYTSLRDRYAAYKSMLADCDNQINIASGNNTGKYLRTTAPTICGGDI